MQVLEENETNYLILTEDGSTETKTKSSNLNQLLFQHNLYGLLREGSEVWMSQGAESEPRITIVPGNDAQCYTLQIEDRPNLTLGAHHKTDLVDALSEIYREHDNKTVLPILRLYNRIREDMIREEPLSKFLTVLSDKVAKRDDGWFINGHLLLTYEGEFYHSENVSRDRSGGIIGEGTSKEAYGMEIDNPGEEMERQIEVDGTEYYLTESEVEFLAKALWAIENTPDMT